MIESNFEFVRFSKFYLQSSVRLQFIANNLLGGGLEYIDYISRQRIKNPHPSVSWAWH